MADVFISYHRSKGTSALVRRIAKELENAKISCWYDTKNTLSGNFVKSIVTEIRHCKVFLFIWDDESNKAPFYVEREIHTAASLGNIALVPFRVGAFELNPDLEFYFKSINALYGGDSLKTASTEELVNVIAQHLKPLPPPIEFIKGGFCGEHMIYMISKNGLLTIAGNGNMQDYTSEDVPWRNEREMISFVEILGNVTSIGTWAFANCTRLISVGIPDNVTSITHIGNLAFYNCASLKSFIIPDNVISIGIAAFEGCTSLEDISLPDSITKIGDFAFNNCKNLSNVSIPDSKISIGWSAFRACNNLVNLQRRKILT